MIVPVLLCASNDVASYTNILITLVLFYNALVMRLPLLRMDKKVASFMDA